MKDQDGLRFAVPSRPGLLTAPRRALRGPRTAANAAFLHGLVGYNNERLVRLAPEYGADPEVRDSEHRRPIDFAGGIFTARYGCRD